MVQVGSSTVWNYTSSACLNWSRGHLAYRLHFGQRTTHTFTIRTKSPNQLHGTPLVLTKTITHGFAQQLYSVQWTWVNKMEKNKTTPFRSLLEYFTASWGKKNKTKKKHQRYKRNGETLGTLKKNNVIIKMPAWWHSSILKKFILFALLVVKWFDHDSRAQHFMGN